MRELQRVGKVLPSFLKRDLRSAAFQALKLDWPLRSGLSIRVSSHSDWIIFNEIFVNGDYDDAILMAMERAQTGAELKILDLGANVGFFSLRCLDLLHRRHLEELPTSIVAVEGNPKTFRSMMTRLSAQKVRCPVNVVNGLVGYKKGTGTITDFEISGNNRVLSGEPGKAHTVDYVDLDCFPALQSRIDLLKCDIEGGELLFLQNYRELLQRTQVGVFELHDDQCDTNECRRLLREAGFKHFRDLVSEGALSLVLVWR